MGYDFGKDYHIRDTMIGLARVPEKVKINSEAERNLQEDGFIVLESSF